MAVSLDTAVVGAVREDGLGLKHGAAYVFQRAAGGVDNWGQVKKLAASDGQDGGGFGGSVAISGDTMIVGADNHDSGAGAAYVYQRDQGGADNWGEVKKLSASDTHSFDAFGISVAVSAGTALVGAHHKDGGGAAYIFQRDRDGANNWGEVKKLTASDAERRDRFGISVAVSGDTAVVGANFEDAGGDAAGAAYIFQRDQGGAENWGEVKKLTASDAQPGDFFGAGVAVVGDTAVVGAWGEDSRGDQTGAAYVFRRDSGGADNWGDVQKLTASDPQRDYRFGWSVAVSGETAVVGRFHINIFAVSDPGAAYVFRREQGGADNWGEVQKLTPSGSEAGDQFGNSVAVSSDTAVVGARLEDAGSTNAGAAYVFRAPLPTPTPAATGTPLPPPVGGIAVDPELSALPLEATDASGSDPRPIASLLAAATAGIAILGGLVWFESKRRSRQSA